ncbi:glucokinase [Desulfomarina sp.]
MDMAILLVADVGGTKSEVALYEITSRTFTFLTGKRYVSSQFSSLREVIATFLADMGTTPQFAVLGVAGVVSGRTAVLTNLEWERIDCTVLEKRFGFTETVLVNDLTALAGALPLLAEDDLVELKPGTAFDNEIKGVLAPGTGLGQGFLIEGDGRFFARGSEGGHVDFGPVTETELALLTWMRRKKQPVSYENFLSGPGISLIYDFCREYYRFAGAGDDTALLAGDGDRTPAIVELGVQKECPWCRRSLELFLAMLGSEAGNLALKLSARGGIYIGGGIVPRLSGRISFDTFLNRFVDKGPMAELLRQIPVKLIVRKEAALLGAVRIGQLFLQS